jgi:Flp pilus assembly pilin Flp
MLTQLLHDESGFIISSELVLVATLLVLGMVVGLSEVQHAVVSELNDVADAIGRVNQSYWFTGFSKVSFFGAGVKAFTRGSFFFDAVDECDNNQCALDCNPPVWEGPKFGAGFGGGFGGAGFGGTCALF